MPPPPRGRSPNILIVGITPNQNAAIAFGDDLASAKDFARRFEYVPGGPVGTPDLRHPYYIELLQLLRTIDDALGVWWQVELGPAGLLVEFTDCLHTASPPGQDLFHGPHAGKALRVSCQAILRHELEYLEPKCVIANGVAASEMLWQLVRPLGAPNHPDRPYIVLPDLNCSVHFSGFMTGMNMDRFAKRRLLAEIKDHSPVWRESR